VAVANESALSFYFWFNNSGLRKLIQSRSTVSAKKQEKQADRDAKISQIKIFPGDLTIDLNDRVKFNAIAIDASGNTIGGVKVNWNARGATSDRHIPISARGDFEADRAGTFTVTAEARGKSAEVTVIVRPGVRRDLSVQPTSIRPVSSRDVPAVKKISTNRSPSKNEANNPARNPVLLAKAKRAHASKRTIAAASMPFLGDVGWDDTNYWSADKPENRVGGPLGTAADGGAGSGNFQFAAPIVSLPGRGINISLGLAYNSRLWNKAGSQISYDTDRGWPAPGFSLGFGKLLGMGVY